MKGLLFGTGLLALAVVLTVAMSAPAASDPVTSDDVRLVSEEIVNHDGSLAQGKGRGNGFRSAIKRSCRHD